MKRVLRVIATVFWAFYILVGVISCSTGAIAFGLIMILPAILSIFLCWSGNQAPTPEKRNAPEPRVQNCRTTSTDLPVDKIKMSSDSVYVVIDVETTGVNPYKDRIVQLSAIRFENEKPVAQLNSYVNPLRPIPSKVIEIHGITNEMVQQAPTIDKLKDDFLALIDGTTLLGYNACFDLNFLDLAFNGALAGVKYIDVLDYSRYIGDLPNYRLETVARSIGFNPPGGFHDALTDCAATAAVFFELSHRQISISSKSYVPQKLDEVKKKRYQNAGFQVSHITASCEITDTEHPLYGKNIVFTGELSIGRQEAAQLAVNVGAVVKSGVSSKTHYLIVGTQDTALVGDNGMSTKEEKVYELNKSGKASIKIIGEREFLALVEG